MTTPRRALLSVSDKSGIAPFAQALVERGFELLSTGGTAKTLREAGLPVTGVSEVTGHPEILDGRVKTLHPAIHGPLLARRDLPEHGAALDELGYGPIDLVAVNLYPFRETVATGGVSVADAMEQVDIGGPTMIRAAAKNHAFIWVVVDPADYPAVLAALDGEGAPAEGELRRRLGAKVFRHISGYDTAVADFLEGAGEDSSEDGGEGTAPARFPETLTLSWSLRSVLRYGENPDQEAAFYAGPGADATAPGEGIAALEQRQGKALSYNNLLDLDGALLSLAPFAHTGRAAVVIVKHTTPCGVAVGRSLEEAYRKALACDPVSAFGGIIAVNRPVDGATATAMSELFLECIVAPAFQDEAMEIFSAKKNLRLLTLPSGVDSASFLADHGRVPDSRIVRGVYGGLLVQSPPTPPFFGVEPEGWTTVTKRAPTDDERGDLAFAWAATFGVKSNAIVLARGGATLGIGAGQMSRVDASRLAVQKAGDAGLSLHGCALASDAFFPFRDGVDAAAAAGVGAIIQPGGSVRDQEVIEAADEHGIAMVFTGRRLFRH